MRQKNIIVILFVLIAFLSQASASLAVSSPMKHLAMQDSLSSSSLMASNDLSCKKDTLVKPDCCKSTHSCSMVSCLATIAMLDHQVLLPERIITRHNATLIIRKLPHHSSSLYRPPIIV
ncbi:hypothetical protein [Marinomonas flavescens]|uniref:hypothetical protein n=1 Tax=Marinomonas flavescens TaxID=2529379 RepID=UPI001055D535|nr:hypothetical protein [Marinomonas flavescens]